MNKALLPVVLVLLICMPLGVQQVSAGISSAFLYYSGDEPNVSFSYTGSSNVTLLKFVVKVERATNGELIDQKTVSHGSYIAGSKISKYVTMTFGPCEVAPFERLQLTIDAYDTSLIASYIGSTAGPSSWGPPCSTGGGAASTTSRSVYLLLLLPVGVIGIVLVYFLYRKLSAD